MNRKYLFIVGCPRSGTTEFVEVINKHDGFAIASERFLYLYSQYEDWTTSPGDTVNLDCFGSERFFDIRQSDTFFCTIEEMSGWQLRDGQDSSQRLASAVVVGDKTPIAVFYLGELHILFPSAKFVVMFRDITSVCRSWARRAADPSDLLWRREDGFEAGVRVWLDVLHATIDYRRRGFPLIDVFAPALYRPDTRALDRVFSALGVDAGEAFQTDFADCCRQAPTDRCPASPTSAEKGIIMQNFEKIWSVVQDFPSDGFTFGLDDAFWPGFREDFRNADGLNYRRQLTVNPNEGSD